MLALTFLKPMILLLHLIHSGNCQNCRITKENQNFLILSEKQTDANTAIKTCSSSGGKLAEVTSQTASNKTKLFLKENLISNDLVLVTISNVQGENNTFRYIPDDTVRESRSVDDPIEPIKPSKGRLQSFYLFKKKTNPFTKIIKFCYVKERDFIRDDCESNEWNFNFVLYGGTNSTNQTIILYSRYNSIMHSTNLFLNNSVNISNVIVPNFPNIPHEIFIPDISIFIGARSDAGSTNWFWNNGTMVNNLNFPPSNKNICQQMTWPFTYTDGINLRPKKCEEKSHFFCSFEFDVEVKPDFCNGSVLEVSWNFYNFTQITKTIKNLYVQIVVNGTTQKNVSYEKSSARLFGLTSETIYHIEAKIISTSCSYPLATSSVKTVKTSFDVIPDPIQNARVSNSSDGSSDCVIKWSFIQEQFDNTNSYTIFFISNPKKYEFLSNTTSLKHNDSLRYHVDTSGYASNTVARFKIQANNYHGGSKISDVSGYCIVPPASSSYAVIVVASVIGFIFIFFAIAIITYFKKKTAIATTLLSKSSIYDQFQLNHVKNKSNEQHEEKENRNQHMVDSTPVYENHSEYAEISYED